VNESCYCFCIALVGIKTQKWQCGAVRVKVDTPKRPKAGSSIHVERDRTVPQIFHCTGRVDSALTSYHIINLLDEVPERAGLRRERVWARSRLEIQVTISRYRIAIVVIVRYDSLGIQIYEGVRIIENPVANCSVVDLVLGRDFDEAQFGDIGEYLFRTDAGPHQELRTQ
jgi:hypothetical protein